MFRYFDYAIIFLRYADVRLFFFAFFLRHFRHYAMLPLMLSYASHAAAAAFFFDTCLLLLLPLFAATYFRGFFRLLRRC